MSEGPQLLVQWTSRWDEFWTSLGPAFARSEAALAGEARVGLFPLRGLLVSWGAEAILLAIAIWLPGKMREMPVFRTVTPPKHEVIYYQGNELPQVEDYGGAETGRSGTAGGQQAHHESQAIKVARGNSRTEKVVDAPNVKLPISLAPVANLLAVGTNPGPPPAEGLKAATPMPSLSKNAIVAPPPEVIRELDRSIPRLNSTVVAPPASAAAERTRQIMGISAATIIAPAPTEVQRDQSRSVVSMTTPIVQPSPKDVPRDPPPLRGPAASNTIIVPPPVSAPIREGTQSAKLNMPAAAVIAPPPSQVTNDRTVSGASLGDPKVVPPPVEVGGRSPDKRAMLGMTAANQVVPPPPSVSGGTSMNAGGRGRNTTPGGFGTVLSADNIVPPPPSMSSDNSGHGAGHGPSGASLGSSNVIPPPPSMSSDNSGRGAGHGPSGATLGSANIVPPPPNLNGGDALTRRGSGNRGAGMGGLNEAGSALAPPASAAGGNGGGKGVVVSSEPGSAKGVPSGNTPGAIAMSPSGNAKSGLGGSGDGSGIGRGTGPGSGLTGEGSGAAKAGTGYGSDPNSHGGISPYPGPGGAGNGTAGTPPAPGVSVNGGNTPAIINLPPMPGFGTGGDPTVPGRSPTASGRPALRVTTKGTSRSGGAFNLYGHLPGMVYSTSFTINGFGTVSMQFSDPLTAEHAYTEDLTTPEVLQATMPVQLKGARIMIEGKMNQSGHLHDFHPVFSDPGAPVAKVVASVSTWKFTPALRGNDPVEVSVMLGFNIDTR